jgi:hypothetical protein
LADFAGAVEQGIVRVTVKMDEGLFGHFSDSQRGRGRYQYRTWGNGVTEPWLVYANA